MGTLITQFYGKHDENATTWKFIGIQKIAIPVILEQQYQLVDMSFNPVEVVQISLSPDGSGLVQYLMKERFLG
jgi:hypothetical protein